MSAYCRSTRDFAGCDRLTEGSEKQCSRIRLLPAAASSRRMNWRSVACSAESGMLLMRPMVRTASAAFCGRSNSSASRGCPGAKAGLMVSGCFSKRMLIPGPAGLFCGLKALMSRTGLCESLVDVLDDVGIVFDTDRKPDGFRQNAGDALLFSGHLAVGGRCGMAGEGFRITDIDEPRDQLQRVIEGLAGFEAAFDPECKQRRGVAIQILLDQRIIGTVWKAGIIDPFDARIGAQEVRDLGRVLDVPFDTQRHRFDALQQQEGIERRQNRSHGALIDAARALNVGTGAELLGVDQSVIGGVGFVEGRKAAGVFRPGKTAAVDNRAAEGGAMAAEELGQR